MMSVVVGLSVRTVPVAPCDPQCRRSGDGGRMEGLT